MFNTDIVTLAIGVVSFTGFLARHFLQCRFIQAHSLLGALMRNFLMFLPVPFFMLFLLEKNGFIILPLAQAVLAGVLATAVYVLMSFFYVLCIFGPYETSVRMRLIREIAQAPKGTISNADLRVRYNDRKIVDIRLERLLGSKDIIQVKDRYRINNKQNIFVLFDTVANFLKKFIGNT